MKKVYQNVSLFLFLIIIFSVLSSAYCSWEEFFNNNSAGKNIQNEVINELIQKAYLPSLVLANEERIETQGNLPGPFIKQNASNLEIYGQPIQECVVKKIIPGHDGRERILSTHIWPHSTHGVLALYFRDNAPDEVRWGSGTLISPWVVLTAAHNLYSRSDSKLDDETRGEVKTVRFFPAMNGKNLPFGPVKVKKFFYPQEFKEWGNEEDYGILILEKPIGQTTGYLGIKVIPSHQLLGLSINITGYPADKVYDKNGIYEMWGMNGSVVRLVENKLYYEIDTYYGQSGSAVVNRDEAEDSYYVIGAHTGGDTDLQENYAALLTRKRFTQVAHWIYDYYFNKFNEEEKNPTQRLLQSVVNMSTTLRQLINKPALNINEDSEENALSIIKNRAKTLKNFNQSHLTENTEDSKESIFYNLSCRVKNAMDQSSKFKKNSDDIEMENLYHRQ